MACQALGFLVPPLLYMRLAASMLTASSLFLLWSLYVPQVGAHASGHPLMSLQNRKERSAGAR